MSFVEKLRSTSSIPPQVKIIAEKDGIAAKFLMMKDENGEALFYKATPENHPELLEVHNITAKKMGIDKPCPIYLCRAKSFKASGLSSVGEMYDQELGTTIYYKPFIDRLSREEFGAMHAHELQHSKQVFPQDTFFLNAVFLGIAGAVATLGVCTMGLSHISTVVIGVLAVAIGLPAKHLIGAKMMRGLETEADMAAKDVWGKKATTSLLARSDELIDSFPEDPNTKLSIMEKLRSAIQPFVPSPIKPQSTANIIFGRRLRPAILV